MESGAAKQTPMRLLLLLTFLPLLTAAQPTGPVLYPVKKDHRWGYMDMEGRLVIPYRYDLIGRCSKSRAYRKTRAACGWCRSVRAWA